MLSTFLSGAALRGGERYHYGRTAAEAPGNTEGVIAAADGGLFRAVGAALGWGEARR